jgi:hypothetical protein
MSIIDGSIVFSISSSGSSGNWLGAFHAELKVGSWGLGVPSLYMMPYDR